MSDKYRSGSSKKAFHYLSYIKSQKTTAAKDAPTKARTKSTPIASRAAAPSDQAPEFYPAGDIAGSIKYTRQGMINRVSAAIINEVILRRLL